MIYIVVSKNKNIEPVKRALHKAKFERMGPIDDYNHVCINFKEKLWASYPGCLINTMQIKGLGGNYTVIDSFRAIYKIYGTAYD